MSSSIHPSTSFVASTSFLDCSGFLSPFRLGFLAASLIAGLIRGPGCLGVTSPWVVEGPSKTSLFILHLPSRPVSCISLSRLSCPQPSSSVIISCQSATVRLRLCLHSIAIVFPIFHQILVVVRSPDLWLPLDSRSPLLSSSPLFVLFLSLSLHLFRPNLDLSQHHRLFLSQHFFLRFRDPGSLQHNLLLHS